MTEIFRITVMEQFSKEDTKCTSRTQATLRFSTARWVMEWVISKILKILSYPKTAPTVFSSQICQKMSKKNSWSNCSAKREKLKLQKVFLSQNFHSVIFFYFRSKPCFSVSGPENKRTGWYSHDHFPVESIGPPSHSDLPFTKLYQKWPKNECTDCHTAAEKSFRRNACKILIEYFSKKQGWICEQRFGLDNFPFIGFLDKWKILFFFGFLSCLITGQLNFWIFRLVGWLNNFIFLSCWIIWQLKFSIFWLFQYLNKFKFFNFYVFW